MPLPISDEEKKRLIHQIFSLFAEHGFDGISMDEVARRVGLSKATLYKYFRGKEDIAREMVREIVTHLDAAAFTTGGGLDDVLSSISMGYFKGVLTAAYSGSRFLTDLEGKYPGVYADYLAAVDAMQRKFTAFYFDAVREGYCRQVSVDLFSEQIKQTLPVIIGADYLRERSMTLPEMLADYYGLLLGQLLSPKYEDAVRQGDNFSFIRELVDVLESNFLID